MIVRTKAGKNWVGSGMPVGAWGVNDLLEIDKDYIVFALEIIDAEVYVYVVTQTQIPSPFPLKRFVVVDSTLPSNWIMAQHQSAFRDRHSHRVIFSYPEWAEQPSYYLNLFEGWNRRACRIRTGSCVLRGSRQRSASRLRAPPAASSTVPPSAGGRGGIDSLAALRRVTVRRTPAVWHRLRSGSGPCHRTGGHRLHSTR